MVRRDQPYRTAAQKKGASVRSRGGTYRGGYTRNEIKSEANTSIESKYKETKYRDDLRTIDIKPKQFTIKIQLKNIKKVTNMRIKDINLHVFYYKFDLYINDELRQKDCRSLPVESLSQLFEKIVQNIRLDDF